MPHGLRPSCAARAVAAPRARTKLERYARRCASGRSGRATLTLAPIPYPSPPVPRAFDPRLIDDLARRLAGAVPENLVALRRDQEQNYKGGLHSQLARLDLVTREEFDVQTAVLKRTREKLGALERRLAELEKPATGAA